MFKRCAGHTTHDTSSAMKTFMSWQNVRCEDAELLVHSFISKNSF